MTLHAACPDRQEAIVALVLGELSKAQADALRDHLAQCEGCRRLHGSLVMEEPELVSTFEAIRRQGQAMQDEILRRVPRARRRIVIRRIGILAAAAAIIVAVVFAASSLSRRPTDLEPNAPPVAANPQPSVPAPIRDTEPVLADKLFAARDIEGLIGMLAQSSPQGQIMAANYLAKIGDARALDALRPLSEAYSGDDPNNPFAAAMTAIAARVTPKEQPSPRQQPKSNAAVSVPPEKAVEMVTYAGIVRDPAGRPIEGVAVRSLFGQDTTTEFHGWEQVRTTNRQGRFQIGPVPMADPRKGRVLIFDHPKYAIGWFGPHQDSYRQPDPHSIEVLLHEPAAVSGIVVDTDGRPLEGAVVEGDLQVKVPMAYSYFSMNRTNGLAVRTDAEGRFTLGRIPADARLRLIVSRRGYVRYSSWDGLRTDTYSVQAGEDVRVKLTRGMTLRGRVLLRGQPYKKQGLLVRADTRNGGRSWCVTDGEGRFEMTDLVRGTYTVRVAGEPLESEGLFCRPTWGVQVGAASVDGVQVHLEEGIPVTVALLDARSGRPVTNEWTRIQMADVSVASGRTDGKGRCTVRLGAGQYYTLVQRTWENGGWGSIYKNFTVAPDANEFRVSVEMTPQPVIQGRLVDSRHMPLRGVVLIGSDDPVRTREDGTFTYPAPVRSSSEVHFGYAFDETGMLGRAFLWRPGGELSFMEIVAEPLASMTGRIVDANNVGVADVTPRLNVMLDSSRGSQWTRDDLWQTSMEEDGAYRFTGVPVGLTMSVFVDKPGFRWRGGEELTLEPGSTISADVVLRPVAGYVEGPAIDWTGTLGGQVVDEDNEQVVGVTVDVRVPGKIIKETTDRQGRFLLEGLPRGQRITGSVSTDGYGSTTFQGVVDGPDLDVRLSRRSGQRLLNKPAPGLLVEKWINAEDVTLERYRGKVVLLQVGILLPSYLPDFERLMTLLDKYGSQGLEVIGIHQRLEITREGQITEDDLRAFVAAHSVTFPFGIDAPAGAVQGLAGKTPRTEGATYSLYIDAAAPELYLVDKKGIVRISPGQDELDAWIERLLRE